jgi:DNA-binding NtrC family response regulator
VTRRADVRIVAATNRDLAARGEAGQFREDLFYRLNVFPLDVPPLRRRPEDVVPLANAFLSQFARRYGRRAARLGAGATASLLAHDWPGNVRELENAIQRAVTVTEGDEVTRGDLPPSFTAPPMLEAIPSDESARDSWSLDEVERDHIVRVLRRQKGNVTNTARQLGISRTTLWRKMHKYRLMRPPAAEKRA